MILMEDEQGLCFWPEELVASITPAYPNRFQVVCADGSVGYTFEATPKVEAGYLRDGKDPGGFEHPGIEPGPAPVYVPEPHLWLRQTAKGLFWDKASPCQLNLAEARRGLVQCGDSWWFQPRRLRRLKRKGKSLVLVMDEGSEIGVGPKWAQSVLQALGASSLSRCRRRYGASGCGIFPFSCAGRRPRFCARTFATWLLCWPI